MNRRTTRGKTAAMLGGIFAGLVAAAVMSCSAPARAQERPPEARPQQEVQVVHHHERARPTGTVTVDTLDLVNGFFSAQVEGAIAPSLTAYGGATFLVRDGWWDDDAHIPFGVGPEVGLRLFAVGDAPAGLWIGPFAGLMFLQNDRQGDSDRDVGYFAGGMAGMNVIVLDALVLSGGVGGGFYDLETDLESVGDELVDGPPEGIEGFWPRFRLGVGVAF